MRKKLIEELNRLGFLKFSIKAATYPIRIIKRRLFEKKLFLMDDNRLIFSEIYKHNYWGSSESFSGPGSTIQYTNNIRSKLPSLIKKYSIKSIFDGPCGDVNWMKEIWPMIDLEYIGGDIVNDIIINNNKLYKRDKINFLNIDITKDKLPNADLMICRDCLFHFSYKDIKMFINNFLESEIKYLLTSTHINNGVFLNKDIHTGDFRLIDLFSSPFTFPLDPIDRFEDWAYPEKEREMCLFTREQILLAKCQNLST